MKEEEITEQEITEVTRELLQQISDSVRYYRRKKELSQTQLAERMNNSQPHPISKLEKMRINDMKISTLARYLVSLDLDITIKINEK